MVLLAIPVQRGEHHTPPVTAHSQALGPDAAALEEHLPSAAMLPRTNSIRAILIAGVMATIVIAALGATNDLGNA